MARNDEDNNDVLMGIQQILRNQGEFSEEINELRTSVNAIRDTIFGNGQPGLKTQIATIGTKLDSHLTNDVRHSKSIKDNEDDGEYGEHKIPDWLRYLILPAVSGGLLWFLFQILPELIRQLDNVH